MGRREGKKKGEARSTGQKIGEEVRTKEGRGDEGKIDEEGEK